jgi:DNA-binding response OmpR family regulator
LIAADADRVINEVTGALQQPGTTFGLCRNGHDVSPAVAKRAPDVVITDLQIGSMGGMAVTMALRLDESGGRLPHVPVLMLLDRTADVHLARRSGADGWLVKPLDARRLRNAVDAVTKAEPYTQGISPKIERRAVAATG